MQSSEGLTTNHNGLDDCVLAYPQGNRFILCCPHCDTVNGELKNGELNKYVDELCLSCHETLDFDRIRYKYPAYSEKYTGIVKNDYENAKLPGHGEPGENCGEKVPRYCHVCGSMFASLSSCMQRECPDCYQKWTIKESKNATYRMWSGSHLVMLRDPRIPYWRRRRYRILHAMVSMKPTGDIVVDRERARDICMRHGIVGGLSIIHTKRQNDQGQFVDDGYIHFHVIGLAPGDILPGGLSDDGGVVFKIIRDARNNDYRGFRRYRDLRACIRYLLSHCAIMPERHSLTWWGRLSYNALPTRELDEAHPGVLEKMNERRNARCPNCGSYDTELCLDFTGGYPIQFDWYKSECRGRGVT